MKFRKYFFTAVLFFSAVLAIPLLTHVFFVPIQFNQFMLQKLELRYFKFDSSRIVESLRSAHSSGLNLLLNPVRVIRPAEPDLESQDSVFQYVFAHLPSFAVVYPTEGFYYFNAKIGGKTISGNIRIADFDSGSFSFAYFDVPHTFTRMKTYSTQNSKNLAITKHSDQDYTLAYLGRTIRFKLDPSWLISPKNPTAVAGERFLGQIYDESGIRFFLYYNEKENSFYDVLNEDVPLADSLESIGDDLFLAKRTGFVFAKDPNANRKVLVGVPLSNIKANNFFDGPADQVPFRLSFKRELNRAYINTLLGDGVNDHGVYENSTEWKRVAVSPYHRFVKLSEITSKIQKCRSRSDLINGPGLVTCFTTEWWNNEAFRMGIRKRLVKEGKKAILESLGV